MALRSSTLILSVFFLISSASTQWVPTSGPNTGSIAWLASSGQFLFAGAGNGVYRTSDNGSGWMPVNVGLRDSFASACIAGASGLWAGTDSGLYHSTDNGAVWAAVKNGLPARSVVPVFSFDATIFAMTDSGLFRSTDGGARWAASRDGLPRGASNPARWSTISAMAACGTDLFAGCRRGLYRSSDIGIHWERRTVGLSDSVFTVFAVSDTTVFAGAGSGRMYRSSDRGNSWVDRGSGPWGAEPLFAIVIRGDRMYAGAGSGIFTSSDEGASWIPASTGLKWAELQCLDVNDSGLFVGTAGGGVWRSTDEGVTWNAVNSGIHDASVMALCVAGNSLYAATYGGGLYRSDDGGSSWTSSHLYPGPTGVLYAVAAKGADLFAGGDGGVYHSTDGGTTWTGNNPVSDPYAPASCLAFTDSGLFAGFYYVGVFRSTDNGAHWQDVTEGLEIPARYNVYALAAMGQRILVGTGVGRGVFVSDDQGVHWSRSSSGYVDVFALGATGTKIYAGTYTPVLRSDDSGSTWSATRVAPPAPISVRSFACSGTNVFAGTYSNGVFLTTDQGASWQAINTGMETDCVQSLAVMDGYLYAGLAGFGGGPGRGVWKRPLTDVLTSVSPMAQDVPQRPYLEQSYPNPFNTSSDIRYQISEFRIVTLTVYDVLGREVAVLVNEHQPPGTYQVRFDASGLASGVYFCRMVAGPYVQTRTMMLLR
jgi:photosystem II stability/assembly factor-like uncharacterized protein